MKKLFTLVAVLVGMAVNSSAQLWLDGQFSLYGDKTSSKNSDNADGEFHFVIAPDMGGVINNDWAWGCTLKFDHGKYTSDRVGSDNKVHTTEWSKNTFSINPYIRRTLVSWDKVSMFTDGMLEFGIGGVKDADNPTTSFGVGLTPGVHFAFCEKAGMVSRLGFLGFRHSGDDNEKSNWFGLDFKSGISFGIYWWLN